MFFPPFRLAVRTRWQDAQHLAALEKKLGYEDIRFYRSIARSAMRKDIALRKKLDEEKQRSQASQQSGWTSWLWGSSDTQQPEEDSAFHGPMSEQQKKELYDVLDYDERTALADSFQAPRDALKMRASAQLKKGSFALKSDPHATNTEIIYVDFDVFQATMVQRPDNFDVSASLGGFSVFDNTTKDTLYRQIVQVKTRDAGAVPSDDVEPFFSVKFEQNPLDERADMALAMKMRHMEVIYHKGYVEAIYKFFKPPANQLESVEALLVCHISRDMFSKLSYYSERG
jgi:vacuolar protein sorting-associated protein 13A/C